MTTTNNGGPAFPILTLRGALIHAARVTICGQAPRRHGLGGA